MYAKEVYPNPHFEESKFPNHSRECLLLLRLYVERIFEKWDSYHCKGRRGNSVKLMAAYREIQSLRDSML
jgi:hypothetical protein